MTVDLSVEGLRFKFFNFFHFRLRDKCVYLSPRGSVVMATQRGVSRHLGSFTDYNNYLASVRFQTQP